MVCDSEVSREPDRRGTAHRKGLEAEASFREVLDGSTALEGMAAYHDYWYVQ
jgi:hypothetical protein